MKDSEEKLYIYINKKYKVKKIESECASKV